MFRLLCSLLGSLSLVAGSARAADAPRLGLDGAFIQFDRSNAVDPKNRLTADQWRAVLSAMKQAGLRTVILQRLQHDSDVYWSDRPDDPTAVTLDYARDNGMQVFIGLRSLEDDKWSAEKFKSDADGVAREKDASLKFIRGLPARYPAHPAFAGWYLSHEIGNEADWFAHPDRLHGFFRALRDECKARAPGKPVALSPYFNPCPGHMTPAEFGRAYAAFLDGAKVDVIMLQDGVGERRIGATEVVARAGPFFAEFESLCRERKVQLWGNVESFDNDAAENRAPTDIRRLSVQIGCAAPYVRRLVTFDFFHYMNPAGHLKEPAYQKTQKKLYDDYKRVYVDRP
jgi:Domain of unknown function (DUF4434)/Domain of unknown function (DUF5109)